MKASRAAAATAQAAQQQAADVAALNAKIDALMAEVAAIRKLLTKPAKEPA